ncbi:Sjogren's syndrome/scleroderma autoantigen 1 family protein [Palaeococcus pacificus]|nr:Sjogren's syndrome/scleroderma autoantigen 1 family protein [Palaeococcus pacificus]
MALTNEEIRKVITPLLLSGAKMLDKHCPKCGAPMFEKDGRVFCPLCEYREQKKRQEMKGIEDILMKKIRYLVNNLPEDLEELERYLDIIEKLIRILEHYKKLEG